MFTSSANFSQREEPWYRAEMKSGDTAKTATPVSASGAWPARANASAVEMIALESRTSTGVYSFGSRTLHLRSGRIAHVSLAQGDPSVGDFLVSAGRLSEAGHLKLRLVALDDAGLESAIVNGDLRASEYSGLKMEVLREGMRSVWMERLIRAFQEVGPAAGALVRQTASLPSDPTHDVILLNLVLDALERHAAVADAEAVGKRAQQWIRFGVGPTVLRAKRWARFDAPRETRVSALLSESPAAASRVAALGCAGLLQILPGSDLGLPAVDAARASSRPPPKLARPPSLRPTSMRPQALPEGEGESAASLKPASASILPASRTARVQLAPGIARPISAPDQPVFPVLTLGDVPLLDPIEDAEEHANLLEANGASGPERARAWHEVAQLFRSRLGALDEHARAAREASAADPTNTAFLREAALACVSIEEVDVALAYGKALIGVARSTEDRAYGMISYALLCRRLGRRDEARQAVQGAVQAAPNEASAWWLAGEIELGAGRRSIAAESFAEAAAIVSIDDAERAHFMSARAYAVDPASPRAVEQYSTCLSRAKHHLAAIELRAEFARLSADPDEKRRLLLTAAERAELHGSSLMAARFLLEAFDTGPSVDVIWAPLDEDLRESDVPREHAIILEEIAAHAGGDDAEWWRRAANARQAIGPDGTLEVELRTRALVADPSHIETLRELESLSARAQDPWIVIAAIERALRGPRTSIDSRRALAKTLTTLAERNALSRVVAWAQPLAEQGAIASPGNAVSVGNITPAWVDFVVRDPAARGGAIQLVRNAIEAQYEPELCRALAQLARVQGDDTARAAAYGYQAAHASNAIERSRLRALEATFASLGGQPMRAANACRDAIAQGVADPDIAIRLRRARTGDPEVDATSTGAAWAAEATHSAGPHRARALAELACIDERRGQLVRAVELAAEALREDANCARAALLLVRQEPVTTDWTRLGADVSARLDDLLGDAPESLRGRILTATESPTAFALVTRWAQLDSTSTAPYFASLAVSEKYELDEHDDAAAASLCEEWRCDPGVLDPILRAVLRIAHRRPRRALERALDAASTLGATGAPLRAAAFQLGVSHQDYDGLIRAAEALLVSQEQDYAEGLRRVARLRREHGDVPGEARTWTRLLAAVPRDAEALHRLAAIYAQAGERERLIAALSLRIEEGATAHERAIGHLELAACYARTLHAPQRAEEHLLAAESELELLDHEEAPLEETSVERRLSLGHALLAMGRTERGISLLLNEAARAEPARAVVLYQAAIDALSDTPTRALIIAEDALLRCGTRGQLLVTFEHLALNLGDVASAVRVYSRLVQDAVGPHGRRALAYRKARWLERAGASSQALDAYVQACEHQASAGALLTSLERLAREQNELARLARGLRALAENAPHPTVRWMLLRRAATVVSNELDDPRAALRILIDEWSKSLSAELEPDLRREAARLALRDAPEARQSVYEVVALLESKAAEAWMGEERAHLLRKAARLFAEGLGDIASAEAYVWRAVDALQKEDADFDAQRVPLDELATWFLAAGQTPDLERWLARLQPIDAPTTPGDIAAPDALVEENLPAETSEYAPATDESADEDATPPASEVEQEPAQPNDEAVEQEPAQPSDEVVAEERAAPGNEVAQDREAPAVQAVEGAPDSSLNDELPSPTTNKVVQQKTPRHDTIGMPERAADNAWNGWSSAAAPPSSMHSMPELLGALPLAERARGTDAAAKIAQRLLAGFDREVTDSSPLNLDTKQLSTLPALSVENDGLALLRRVWENALPLFRTTTRDLGILGTDRVGAHDTSPLGRVIQELAVLMEMEPVVYLVRDRAARTDLLRTAPPSVRITDALARSTSSLRFELARAFALTRPELVLLGALEEDACRTLFSAIRAAFGEATPGADSTRSRETALLASDLWSTLPPIAQREVRRELGLADATFDFESLSLRANTRALTWGIIACGDPALAIRYVLARSPQLASLDVEETFAASPLLAALRDVSLSAAFIAATEP